MMMASRPSRSAAAHALPVLAHSALTPPQARRPHDTSAPGSHASHAWHTHDTPDLWMAQTYDDHRNLTQSHALAPEARAAPVRQRACARGGQTRPPMICKRQLHTASAPEGEAPSRQEKRAGVACTRIIEHRRGGAAHAGRGVRRPRRAHSHAAHRAPPVVQFNPPPLDSHCCIGIGAEGGLSLLGVARGVLRFALPFCGRALPLPAPADCGRALPRPALGGLPCT